MLVALLWAMSAHSRTRRLGLKPRHRAAVRCVQVHAVDLNDKADCAAKFRSNAGLGALVFSGIVTGNLMA